MKCADCKFWRPGENPQPWSDDMGACHRHAPASVGTAHAVAVGAMRNQWPTTLKDDFCGDFVRREYRMGDATARAFEDRSEP
jgi:hypothetical protein